MSDMIDRLRAISEDAGRDIAADLGVASSLVSMSTLVHSGVRRRRLRISAVAAACALFLGIGATVAPGLFADGLKDPIDPAGPTLVRTDGAVTTFSDGSMSVVLSDGSFFTLPPAGPDDMPLAPVRPEVGCAFDPASIEAYGWIPDEPGYGQLAGAARAYYDGEDGRTYVSPGASFTAARDEEVPSVIVEVETDPALAGNVVLLAQWMAIKVEDGNVRHFSGRMTSDPDVRYVGDRSLGTERAIVPINSDSMDLEMVNHCKKIDSEGEELYGDEFGVFDHYLTVDVWLTDHHGIARHIGRYVTVVTITWTETGA